KLGALNEEKNDFDSSIAWYQYAADLMKGSDAGLLRRVSDLRMKKTEIQIAEHEDLLSARGSATGDEVYANRMEELQAAGTRRAELIIEEARNRVERNPTDLQLRFELGEYLVNA